MEAISVENTIYSWYYSWMSAEWTSDARNLIILISSFPCRFYLKAINVNESSANRMLATSSAREPFSNGERSGAHTHTHTICEMIPSTFPNFIPNSSPVEFFDGANARNIFNEIQTKAATETDKMNANVNSYGRIVKMPKNRKMRRKSEKKDNSRDNEFVFGPRFVRRSSRVTVYGFGKIAVGRARTDIFAVARS